MIRTGEKGKQYGLIKPTTSLKPAAAFARTDDDDEEDNDVSTMLKLAEKKQQKLVCSLIFSYVYFLFKEY